MFAAPAWPDMRQLRCAGRQRPCAYTGCRRRPMHPTWNSSKREAGEDSPPVVGPSWFELVRVTGRAPSQVARPWIRPGACYDARHPRPLGDGFRMSPRSPAFGTALVLVSSTFAGVSGLFIRELLVLGLAPLQVVYFSNSLVFLILL